jgi:hypothetical protein
MKVVRYAHQAQRIGFSPSPCFEASKLKRSCMQKIRSPFFQTKSRKASCKPCEWYSALNVPAAKPAHTRNTNGKTDVTQIADAPAPSLRRLPELPLRAGGQPNSRAQLPAGDSGTSGNCGLRKIKNVSKTVEGGQISMSEKSSQGTGKVSEEEQRARSGKERAKDNKTPFLYFPGLKPEK